MNSESLLNAALWSRVSTDEQTVANQVETLQGMARQRGLNIVREFDVVGSAYKGKQRAKLDEVVACAHRGEFCVLLTWSLDRLSRGGVEETLSLLRRFQTCGVRVLSAQEPWLDGQPDTAQLLVSVMAWLARAESARRSERTKAGIKRKMREMPGWKPGRQQGARDKKPRKRSGYILRYERERA